MPFKIVRNDITKVKADVIVNTANPNPICASGTDLAIYEAAGKEKLLAERANIGKIARGDIDSYIDANYVRESHRKEYPVRSRSNALFFDGASTREYAQRMGVSQRAVIKRRDRILRDLKKFFENSSK